MQSSVIKKKPLLLDIFNENFNSEDVDFWKEILNYKEIRQDFIEQAQHKKGNIKLVPSLGHNVNQLNVLHSLEERDLIDEEFVEQKSYNAFKINRGKNLQETLFLSKLVEYDSSFSVIFEKYNVFDKLKTIFFNDREFNYQRKSCKSFYSSHGIVC